MALTPVAYTKNWKDTFGSQEAPESTVNFIAPPVVTLSGVSVRTAAINVSYPLEVTIDWGDGTVQLNQAAGAKTHEYAADGDYVITVMNETYNDVQAQVRARVAHGLMSLSLDATATLLDAEVAITGQVYPITLDWGDGTSIFLPNDAALEANKTHTYEADGTYVVSVLDARVRRSSESLTVAGTAPPAGLTTTPPAPAPAPAPAPNPWEGMTRHDQLNEYIDQANITPAEEWTTMTIADKKAWLTENYAK